MSTDHHQAADGKPVSLKRLLIGTAALPAAALGLMMAFASDADAVPITYDIPSVALSFTTGLHTLGSLSGSFTYDASGNDYSNVDIHLTVTKYTSGSPFTAPNPPGSTSEVLLAFNAGNSAYVELEFTNPLSTQPDPIKGVTVGNNCCVSGVYSANGGVVGATADPVIPEPSSIAILGAALGLFGLRRRRPRNR